MKTKIIVYFCIVVLIWGASGLTVYHSIAGWQNRGTFGDMFGAVNALFSGLAFAGIIIALIFQKDELALQRQELRDTREELKGQREQMELQNESIKKQNFENTFFQLLRFHSEIVNSLDTTTSVRDVDRSTMKITFTNKVISGRYCFRYFYKELSDIYKAEVKNGELQDEGFVRRVYKKFHVKYQADLGHYFRNLYYLVKFVKDSDITDKEYYLNLVRAQLSTYEHLLLFYNCLSKFGYKKFKPLVEEFGLLNDVEKELLIGKHAIFYDTKAFGKD